MLCHNVFAEVKQHLPTLPFAPPPYKSREMAVCINVALLLRSFQKHDYNCTQNRYYCTLFFHLHQLHESSVQCGSAEFHLLPHLLPG